MIYSKSFPVGLIKIRILFFIFLVGCFSFGQIKKWTLQECIDYALSHNLSVLQADLNNELSETQIQEAKNRKLPDLSANVSNQLVFNRGNIPITNASQIGQTATGNLQNYFLNIGVNSNITIYQGGALKLNEKKAALDFESGVYGAEDLKNDISLNIVNTYLNVLLNREVEAVAREQLSVSENQLELNQKLYDGGAIALSTVYEVRAQVAQDKQNLANASIGVDQALFNLAQLLQLPNYKNFDVVTAQLPEEVTLGLYDLAAIEKYAFENQPQTKGAVVAVESAKVDIELAKSQYLPIVSGGYSFSTNFNDELLNENLVFDPFTDQLRNNVSHAFTVNVSVPIFNRFITDLNVEQAEIGTELAQKNLEIEQQNLRQEIQQAYFDVNTTYQQYEAAKETVNSAQLSFDFAQKSFKAGQITVYDFNQSSNTLFAAKSQLLQAKYNFIFRLKVLDFYAGKPLKL